MITDYASTIKSTVSARDACEMYGIQVNRAGFCCCPFHAEKTASMKVYDGDRGWHCFGCHKGGDVIDLVSGLLGLDFIGAVSRINDDFHLGLPINEQSDPDKLRAERQAAYKRRKEAESRRRFKARLASDYDRALATFVCYDSLAEQARAAQSIDQITPDMVHALQHIEEAAYNLERAKAAIQEYERR